MQIQHRHNEKKGMAYVAEAENILAEMTYVMAGPHKMIIDHTEVSPALEGQGVGKKLLEKLVTYARENDIKILPLCPFAKATLDRVTEWQDVLA